jgi:hypothetical protein
MGRALILLEILIQYESLAFDLFLFVSPVFIAVLLQKEQGRLP